MSDKKEEGGEIAQAIVQIDTALSEVEHCLGKLRERMGPVLSPAAFVITGSISASLARPSVDGAGAVTYTSITPQKTKSPLREQLDEVTARSKELNNTLKYLLNALAL
jgi:hypothetical protein